MPAYFEKLGISFQYPETWELDDQLEGGDARTVSVQSPEGAFWMLSVHRSDESPERLCQAAIKTFQEEYQQIDVVASREEYHAIELLGYELNFYCLDLTTTALIQAATTRQGTLMILAQAEDRQFERIALVFQAINASLLEAEEVESGESRVES